MGRFRPLGLPLAVAILFVSAITGCGGGSHSGPPLFPGHINLTPSATTSLTVGGTLTFLASVQTASGTNLSTTVTFDSSDTSILNLAPNGVACAGHWDATFTACTPGATGPVTVTASALGGTSVPTYVFVHPPIDNISVVGVLPTGASVQEPCLSESQSMTIEAHAFSQGADITASVGPFTWSANNTPVVTLTPLNNSTYNFPTSQATATANAPGITYIYASANGVSSSSFQQPQLTNSQGTASPRLDFFATCPVLNIALELGAAGSGQTTFSVAKGTASTNQTIIATVTDIMGYSSLPRTDGGLVLSKTPLSWTSSQPGSIAVPATGCTLSCAVSLANPGSATITASCSPPACNLGYPTIPNAFLTDGQLDPTKVAACTTYFQALFPQFVSCQQLIPIPVYASPVFIDPSAPPPPRFLSNSAAISGVVTGSTSAPTIFSGSTGCELQPPLACNTFAYNLTSRTPGNATQLPVSPNSFLSDPTGTKVWMGSNFGAQLITPSNFNSSSSPFASLGTVTGKILATSLNGILAAFSDTIHQPNQVYIVNSNRTSFPTILTIPSATMAAFTPDGFKGYIVGGGTSLYIYSALQALQGPFPLAGAPSAIAFAPNAAFTFLAETGSSPNLTAFANCMNPATSFQPADTIPLPADPLLMKVLPAYHIDGNDSSGNPIPDGIHILILDSTGFDVITAAVSPPATTDVLCPQQIQLGLPTAHTLQRIDLGQGTLQPLNFFYSADDTQLYIVSSTTSSIIIYSFVNNAVTGGIQLQNNAIPITADMSSDAGTIVIAATDGLLHEVSTALGGSDSIPISFPNAPNALNPFCSIDPNGVPCTLNVAQVKP